MQLTIQLPASTERRLRDRAKAEGVSIDQLASSMLESIADTVTSKKQTSGINPDWIDYEYLAECEADQSPVVSKEEIRMELSKIPGSMTADFIAERTDKYLHTLQ